jgi:histidine triad (HIT) family protein
VIPKAHYPNVFEIAPEAFAAAARTAARVASAVNQAVKPDGLNLIQANGVGAGQSVAHFHLHVFPRRLNDGVAINWDPKPGDHAHIAEIAERIRALL